MKKTAILLLLLFAFVQVGPAVSSLFQPAAIVFMVDEEKTDDKTEKEKKEKKNHSFYACNNSGFALKIRAELLHAEKICPSPCLEKLTPPPNC